MKPYYAGRNKSAKRVCVEQSVSKLWLANAYHTEGLRYVARELSVTPWSLLRILDGFDIKRLGNRSIAPNARVRMIATISVPRHRRVNLAKRDLVKSLKLPMPEFYPFFHSEVMEKQELTIIVNAAVPKMIPENQRRDICQNLLVALLEERIAVIDLVTSVPGYIREQYRMFPAKYGPISIDAPIRRDGEGGYLRDFIVDPNAEQGVDGEDLTNHKSRYMLR